MIVSLGAVLRLVITLNLIFLGKVKCILIIKMHSIKSRRNIAVVIKNRFKTQFFVDR